MLGYGSFSELTFSGNKSATRTYNSKNINVILGLVKSKPVTLKVIKIEPPEDGGIILYITKEIPILLKVLEIDTQIVTITLSLNKSKGLEI